MKLLKLNRLIFFFLLLILISCKDANEYRVDNEFEEYLYRFENEAGKRGVSFDIKTSGIIIEFTNLKDNKAGLTHHENPVRIEIDRTYWEDISKYSGADLMKEDLIFHELGHGLLNRDHLNSILENGDWKSIMCGGTKVDNRPWNINYRGIRRDYYIDELFNESTVAPEFASMNFSGDTTSFISTSVLSFNSENKEDTGWQLIDGTYYKTSVDFENGNGRLKFESKLNDVFLVLATMSKPVDINSNFSFEMNIQYKSGNDSDQYGIVLGNTSSEFSGKNDSIEYFTINNNRKMHMGNRTWYTFYTELNRPEINPNLMNKLKIFKIGDMMFYFVNNIYCYTTKIELTKNINNFGFYVPSNATVWVDDFVISQEINQNLISSKIKSTGEIKYQVQATNQPKNCFLNR